MSLKNMFPFFLTLCIGFSCMPWHCLAAQELNEGVTTADPSIQSFILSDHPQGDRIEGQDEREEASTKEVTLAEDDENFDDELDIDVSDIDLMAVAESFSTWDKAWFGMQMLRWYGRATSEAVGGHVYANRTIYAGLLAGVLLRLADDEGDDTSDAEGS